MGNKILSDARIAEIEVFTKERKKRWNYLYTREQEGLMNTEFLIASHKALEQKVKQLSELRRFEGARHDPSEDRFQE